MRDGEPSHQPATGAPPPTRSPSPQLSEDDPSPPAMPKQHKSPPLAGSPASPVPFPSLPLTPEPPTPPLAKRRSRRDVRPPGEWWKVDPLRIHRSVEPESDSESVPEDNAEVANATLDSEPRSLKEDPVQTP